MYHVDNDYMPTHEAGLRWNDPSLGIEWALPVTEIHPRDAEWTLIEHRNLS
jgi:dTDP-4-dehydrorhamnose 3,5-epimerase